MHDQIEIHGPILVSRVIIILVISVNQCWRYLWT